MTEPKTQYDELYKIILVGDSSVGKTSFLIRLTKNVIKKQVQPTIGVEYAAQSILLADIDTIVKSVIWDTAGAERYKAITTAHYRKSEGALLFYDLCDKNSFDNVLNWRQEIIQHTDDKIVIMLIGNKLDLLQENPQNRCVSVEEVEHICQQYNMLYNETSAKDGINVKECFEQFIRKIYESKQLHVDEEIPNQPLEIDDIQTEKKTLDNNPQVCLISDNQLKKNKTSTDDCCITT